METMMSQRPGQYKTETEIRAEIKRLEEIAAQGELTLPLAQELNHLRAELEEIANARYKYHRPWPDMGS